MRFPTLAAIATALVLTGCWDDESLLQDTLMFPPGLDIQYLSQRAKLYGTSKCVQGTLSGHSCLIFPPRQETASGIIISGTTVHQVTLQVTQDPENPVYFLIKDSQGNHVLSTTGRHDEYGNIDVRPVHLE